MLKYKPYLEVGIMFAVNHVSKLMAQRLADPVVSPEALEVIGAQAE